MAPQAEKRSPLTCFSPGLLQAPAPDMTRLEPAFCGLLPHPPIVVPEVGGDRLAECRTTFEACTKLAARLVASRPDRLVLVSPHSPRAHDAFGLWDGPDLAGDLAAFGAPNASVRVPADGAARSAVEGACAEADVATWPIPPQPLDHGAVVPLWFVCEAGWHGPTCVTSLPWRSQPARMVAFGEALARALSDLPGRTALVASGDMTHRATPDAPAGYHPRAVEFDRTLTDLVAAGLLAEIPRIDPALRDVAAEDAADSVTIVAAAIGFEGHGVEVLGYEHPFGVGYLVAVLHDGGSP